MPSLHELAFQTLFAQLEDTAQSQALIPLESPGLKIEQTVKGIDYVYWRRTKACGFRTVPQPRAKARRKDRR